MKTWGGRAGKRVRIIGAMATVATLVCVVAPIPARAQAPDAEQSAGVVTRDLRPRPTGWAPPAPAPPHGHPGVGTAAVEPVGGPRAGALADTAEADGESTEPLFGRRDAWTAAGFALGTVLLAPLDVMVAEAVQDSSVQADRMLRGGAGLLRWLGFPGAAVVSGGLYAGGLLLGDRVIADVGLHTTTAIVIAEAVTLATKAVVGRARPKLDTGAPFDVDLFRGFTHDDYQSFPSGHTTAAFAAAAALTTEISRHHPEAKVWVGTLMFGGATMAGVSRLYHNEHWASDVMAGAAIGSFAGWKIVRYLHDRPGNRLDRWLLPRAAVPDPVGGVTLVWSVPAGR